MNVNYVTLTLVLVSLLLQLFNNIMLRGFKELVLLELAEAYREIQDRITAFLKVKIKSKEHDSNA